MENERGSWPFEIYRGEPVTGFLENVARYYQKEASALGLDSRFSKDYIGELFTKNPLVPEGIIFPTTVCPGFFYTFSVLGETLGKIINEELQNENPDLFDIIMQGYQKQVVEELRNRGKVTMSEPEVPFHLPLYYLFLKMFKGNMFNIVQLRGDDVKVEAFLYRAPQLNPKAEIIFGRGPWTTMWERTPE